jgi:hypothetical protein
MNFRSGFLNNKFGIFGEEEEVKISSDSSCFDTDQNFQHNLPVPDSKPTVRSKKKYYSSKNNKYKKYGKYRRRSSSIQNIFKSLGVCSFFQTGRCNRGTKCFFVHQLISLKHISCVFFQQGRCKFGENCIFDHPYQQRHIQDLEQDIQELRSMCSELQKENEMLQAEVKKNKTLKKPKYRNHRYVISDIEPITPKDDPPTAIYKYECQNTFSEASVLPVYITDNVERRSSPSSTLRIPEKIEKKTQPTRDKSANQKINEIIQKISSCTEKTTPLSAMLILQEALLAFTTNP